MQIAVVDRINLLLKRKNVEATMIKNAMTSVLSALAPTEAIVVSNTTSQREVAYFKIDGTFLPVSYTHLTLPTTPYV